MATGYKVITSSSSIYSDINTASKTADRLETEVNDFLRGREKTANEVWRLEGPCQVAVFFNGGGGKEYIYSQTLYKQ